MEFKFNDGGRSKHYSSKPVRDCGVRALAIVLDKDYKEVYKKVYQLCKTVKTRGTGFSHPRTGIHREIMEAAAEHYGLTWVATMQIGQGCTTHLDASELPPGRILCRVSNHYAAVVDGVLNDTYDCSRGGKRCVYGYYYKA